MHVASLNVELNLLTMSPNDEIQHPYSASAMDVASLNVLKSRYTS